VSVTEAFKGVDHLESPYADKSQNYSTTPTYVGKAAQSSSRQGNNIGTNEKNLKKTSRA
jgi:hypothetical protein